MKTDISEKVKLKKGYIINEDLISSIIRIIRDTHPDTTITIIAKCGPISNHFSSLEEFVEKQEMLDYIDKLVVEAKFITSESDIYSKDSITFTFDNDEDYYDSHVNYSLRKYDDYVLLKNKIDNLLTSYKTGCYWLTSSIALQSFCVIFCIIILNIVVKTRQVTLSSPATPVLLLLLIGPIIITIGACILIQKYRKEISTSFEFDFGKNRFKNDKIKGRRNFIFITVIGGFVISIIAGIIVNILF